MVACYVGMYMFKRSIEDELAADHAAKEFADYVRSVIAERRAEPKDDLLSHMIHTEHKGQLLTDEELVSTTIVLLNAGMRRQCTSSVIRYRVILESGLDTQSLFSDEKTTERTVEETLRIGAPVHIFQRWALEPVEIDGVRFERGER